MRPVNMALGQAAAPQITVATLKLFGGHVALDFTNTVNSRGAHYGPDVLHSYGDLVDWGLRLGVLGTAEAKELRALSPQRGQAALARAKRLREALYRIFSRERAAAADLKLLQRELLAAQATRALARASHGYAWRWKGCDADAISHRVALAAAELLASPSLSRVHVCPGEDCSWLFLDGSRPGRRIWCNEEACGTRNRVRRWRRRQRSRASR
jgi:predicted RNA-binding Zn ribbon-like protein